MQRLPRVSRLLIANLLGALVLARGGLLADEVHIEVDANHAGLHVPRTLTGSCIEDVNHEIYGGLYSQMIFGESFQEPCVNTLVGFKTPDGSLGTVDRGELVTQVDGTPRKAVSERAALGEDGRAGVAVFFQQSANIFAGLMFQVTKAEEGSDSFSGYEASLNPELGIVRLERHQYDSELLKETKVPVPAQKWITLSIRRTGTTIEVMVDSQLAIRFDDGANSLPSGAVGIRHTQGGARFRELWIQRTGGEKEAIPFKQATSADVGVSREWRMIRTGSASGEARLVTERPFVGSQSQRLTFLGGDGQIGLTNAGLFGRPVGELANTGNEPRSGGMNLVGGRPYEGCISARAEKACNLAIGLESADGSQVYAQSSLHVAGGDQWQRLDFTLTPAATEPAGRFAIKLNAPGAVVLGYAYLQPGDWGRFKGLALRRDVVEAMIGQGVTVLRYGGAMVNAEGYRWKKMIGPREKREPYRGTWYPYSSNGWGIPDFLEMCGAAGFLGIPAINMDEAPQDVADLVEFANGAADSPWGSKRAAAGHPAPYGLRIIEIGNEQKVDEGYWEKFRLIAEAVWAKDPSMILAVGDVAYNDPITDPFHFSGSPSGITTLAAHQKILDLARRHGSEVWFDVHVWDESPSDDGNPLGGVPSFANAIDTLANGAKYRVAIFELNADRHDQGRALANAMAIQAAERLGDRISVVTSANGLQPDGHNDNDWDQGLLFLNSSRVWLQPPGYVTRMISRHYEPIVIPSTVSPADRKLQVLAARSDDGGVLVLQVVNINDQAVPAKFSFQGFSPAPGKANAEELVGPLKGANISGSPEQVVSKPAAWPYKDMSEAVYTLKPNSFTILQWEQ